MAVLAMMTILLLCLQTKLLKANISNKYLNYLPCLETVERINLLLTILTMLSLSCVIITGLNANNSNINYNNNIKFIFTILCWLVYGSLIKTYLGIGWHNLTKVACTLIANMLVIGTLLLIS